MGIKKHKGIVNFKKIKKLGNIRDKYKEKVTHFLELPQEVIGENTRISVVDNRLIYLEGRNKIEDYYEHYIRIKTSKNTIVIDGKDMIIQGMEDNELVVEGKIFSISYN